MSNKPSDHEALCKQLESLRQALEPFKTAQPQQQPNTQSINLQWEGIKQEIRNSVLPKYAMSGRMGLELAVDAAGAWVSVVLADATPTTRAVSIPLAVKMLESLKNYIAKPPDDPAPPKTAEEKKREFRAADMSKVGKYVDDAIRETEGSEFIYSSAAYLVMFCGLAFAIAAIVIALSWIIKIEQTQGAWPLAFAMFGRVLAVSALAYLAGRLFMMFKDLIHARSRIRDQRSRTALLGAVFHAGDEQKIAETLGEYLKSIASTGQSDSTGIYLPTEILDVLAKRAPELAKAFKDSSS